MAEKRKRGQNFTAKEKDKLVKLLASYRDTILNKKTDGSTNKAKTKAWIEVTNAFNASANVYRNKDSLMKLWEKLKTESKLNYESAKKNTTGTGGEPADVLIDPFMEGQPHLSQRNERTEAVSCLCTGFENINRKEDIVDLKRQLLQEEIEFKRKSYALQLEAAATEVEIKAEILKQMKSGAVQMNMMNLL